MKKRLIVLGLSALICVSFSCCGKEAVPKEVSITGKTAEDYKKDFDKSKKALKKISDEMKEKNEKEKKAFEKNQVKVKNVEFEDERYGRVVLKSYGLDDDKIVFTYEYTNMGDKDWPASVILGKMDAYQDGASLLWVYSKYDEDYNTLIKPGATVKAGKTYVLRDKKTDIEIEFKENDEVKKSYTIKLKK